MILAIDIGNTNVVLGGIEGNDILFEARMATDPIKTSDQYCAELKNILALFDVVPSMIDGTIVASVVPPVLNSFRTAIRKLTGKSCLVVGPGIRTGLNIRMDNPAEIGSDLIVASVAAIHDYGAPLLILADDMTTLPDGRLQYGRHIEVVGWEKGINVWELYPDPNSPKGQHTANLGRFEFPIEGGTRFTLFTRVNPDGTLTVGAREGSRTCTFPCPARVSKDFYAGITACEGKNYFYNFSIHS